MAFDHESWLRKQGVKIVGRHTLRRASAPTYMNWASEREDGRIDWVAEHLTTTEEQVYQVELNEQTIERFERFEATIKQALDYANRYNPSHRTSPAGYSGYGPNDVSDFMIENKERHLELLKENSMYKDAWKEFQTVRVLLGESPHWP
jgi:hypothetical protein